MSLRDDAAPPPGWLPLFRTSPYLDLNGPFFYRPHSPDQALSQGFLIGFRALPKHANARGKLHGGVFATVADVAMGYALTAARTLPGKLVTTGLTLDYVGGGDIGDWITVEVTPVKNGKALAIAHCTVRNEAGVLAIARASFLAA